MKSKLAQRVCAIATMTMGLALASTAQAGVTFTDLGGGQYGVTLDPITFTVGTNASAANRMVIEDFFTTNATGTGVDISGDILWSRNGGPAIAISFETNNGSCPCNVGQVDANDLLFNFTIQYSSLGVGGVLAGDTITLSTNNMIFSTIGTRIENVGVHTAYLLNGTTAIASTTVDSSVAVPEPASLALLGLGLAGLGLSRRRKPDPAV